MRPRITRHLQRLKQKHWLGDTNCLDPQSSNWLSEESPEPYPSSFLAGNWCIMMLTMFCESGLICSEEQPVNKSTSRLQKESKAADCSNNLYFWSPTHPSSGSLWKGTASEFCLSPEYPLPTTISKLAPQWFHRMTRVRTLKMKAISLCFYLLGTYLHIQYFWPQLSLGQ